MSELDLILPRGGQRQLIATFDGVENTSTGALVANSIYKARVRPVDWITLTQLHVNVVTNVAGNIDVAILDPTTGARLAGPAAQAAIGATGTLQSFTLTAAITLSPFLDYDFAVGADVAVVLQRSSGYAYTNTLSSRAMRKGSAYSSGIPNPVTAFVADAVAVWIAGT